MFPPPEPQDLPSGLIKGDRWFLDPKTDKITSTYYNRRYRVNVRAVGEQWNDDPVVVKNQQERL